MKEGSLTLPDGRTLAYAEHGDPHGKPVFFFHGIPGSRIFRPTDEVTGRLGARLITIDRPGSGLSTYQRGRRYLDWPKDLAALADSLGVHRFHVAGHSGGGPYTLVCAYALPERVIGATAISSGGPPEAKEALESITPLNKLGFRLSRFMPWPIWRLIVWYLYRMGRDNSAYLFERAAGDRASADTAILAWPGVLEINYASQSECFRQGTKAFAAEARLLTRPWGFSLEEIRVPVHFWHGSADVDTPVAFARYLAERVPGSRLTICEGAAHMMIYPHWEEILTDLLKTV